jgi:uncharacterized protein YecE (DUF72 family)
MSDTKPALRVACLGFRGGVARYFGRLSALELPVNEGGARTRTLSRWRTEAPAHADFIPRVDPGVLAADFHGPAAETAFARTLSVCRRVGATTALLNTPASFRPTAHNRARIESFFAERQGVRVAWWADGLWSGMADERDALCAQAGLIPVIDPLALDDHESPPEGDTIYWRLRGKVGMRARFSDHDLDRLLAMCVGRTQGHVVFTLPEMLRDATRLQSLLAHGAAAPVDDGDLFDDEGEADGDAAAFGHAEFDEAEDSEDEEGAAQD